jgi:hypothetical protein
MKLRFEVGKTNLNMNDPQNREEMNKLQAELLAIEQDKNSDLRSLKIVGSASPEGKLKTNTRLAKGRLNSALNIVLSNINEEQKAKADFSTDSYVVPWEEVAKLLRNDGFNEEALAIEKILNRYGNIDQQGAQIRKLNFYKSLLLNFG